MTSARFRVLDPGPLRKIERHKRVCCKSSKYWSTAFAISDPHEGIARQCRNIGRTIYQQIVVVVDPNELPGKRLGRRSFDLLPTLLEFAAMTWTRDDAQLLLPRRQATEVGANCTD